MEHQRDKHTFEHELLSAKLTEIEESLALIDGSPNPREWRKTRSRLVQQQADLTAALVLLAPDLPVQ